MAAGADPDQLADAMWSDLERWALSRGYLMAFHEQVPASEGRWIGLVPCPGPSIVTFGAHCLVMQGERIIFDPAAGAGVIPAGYRLRVWSQQDITAGITFTKPSTRS